MTGSPEQGSFFCPYRILYPEESPRVKEKRPADAGVTAPGFRQTEASGAGPASVPGVSGQSASAYDMMTVKKTSGSGPRTGADLNCEGAEKNE